MRRNWQGSPRGLSSWGNPVCCSGHIPMYSGPLETTSILASFRNVVSLLVLHWNTCFFLPSHFRAHPGSKKKKKQNVCQPIYRKPAQAWPLSRKSYTCCSTHLFLKNNSFYLELYRNRSAPFELKSNTQWHSKAPRSTKRSDCKYVLGMTNTYQGTACWWQSSKRIPLSGGIQHLEVTCSLSSQWSTP